MERDFSKKSMFSYNKHLRYVSSSIPLCCIVALLLLSICIISPDGFNSSSVYAEENTSSSSGEAVGGTEIPDSSFDTTASLQVTTGSLDETTLAGAGNVSYRSHNISYSVQNSMDYTLRVSYASGNRALQYYGPNGTAVSTAGTSVSGVGNGVEANNIPDNSWGFAWSDNTETSNEAMTYYTMPTNNNGTGLSNGVLTSGTESVDSIGKLTFAAKFANDAIAGHYKAQVLLSLAAMPHTVVYQVTYDCRGGTGCPSNINSESTASSYQYTIPSATPIRDGFTFLGYSTSSTATVANSDYAPGKMITLTTSNPNRTLYAMWESALTSFPSSLDTMQNMTNDICDSVKVGTSKLLRDSRDNSSYTVTKLEDKKCWMTQNLRLTNKNLTSNDSDVSANYFLPAAGDVWKDSDESNTISKVYYSGNTQRGAHYTWCAATAGSCSNAITNNAIARDSICPKGWRLPTRKEYDTLWQKTGISELTTSIEKSKKAQSSPYNFDMSGVIYTTSFQDYPYADNKGSAYYLTSVAYGDYGSLPFILSDRSFGVSSWQNRSCGGSVRCVAR